MRLFLFSTLFWNMINSYTKTADCSATLKGVKLACVLVMLSFISWIYFDIALLKIYGYGSYYHYWHPHKRNSHHITFICTAVGNYKTNAYPGKQVKNNINSLHFEIFTSNKKNKFNSIETHYLFVRINIRVIRQYVSIWSGNWPSKLLILHI